MPSRILFVSRRSSLRSVLAQACLTHMGGHHLVAQYCGQPGFVERTIHPAALAALDSAHIPAPAMPPRPWTDLWRMGSPRLDLVVTLDEAVLASEPSWPDQPISALWAFEDAAAMADPADAARAAMRILYSLQRRLELLVNLPLGRADSSAIRSDLRDLGRMA
ncbi:MAG: protein tyrosine phosphatase [Proteobacteria bacterium]|nr:protein tyrosine phosphatase [Pseudomonadota bacterium]